MTLHRWRAVMAAVALLSVSCDKDLHCEDKGAVERSGTCTCGPGKRLAAEGDRCVSAPDHTEDSSSHRDDEDAAAPPTESKMDAAEPLDADASTPEASAPDARPDADAGTPPSNDDAQVPVVPPGPTVILDLATRQPPTEIPAGAWPAEMRNGHWRFTWTPSFASTEVPIDGRANVILFQFGGTANSNDAIWLEKQGTICKAWVTSDAPVLLEVPSLVFSAGQAITYEIDLPRGTWTISGATAGNGTVSNGGPFSWPSATLFVGRSPAGALERFVGTFSDVEAVP